MQENEQEELYLSVYVSAEQAEIAKEIDEYIETKLGHEVIAAKRARANVPVNIEQLEQDTEDCSFAVIVMAGTTASSREQLLHEIGYCQGTFGCQNVLVLRPDNVPAFANMTGVMYEVFSGENIRAAFPRIRTEIDAAIERFLSDDDIDED